MMTLPTNSDERKTYPLYRGLFGYFGPALAGVAHHSWKSNDKHNPGQPMYWSVNKSTDHADCILRHLLDLGDLETQHDSTWASVDAILTEADALAWRALALSTSLRIKYGRAPLPFNARK